MLIPHHWARDCHHATFVSRTKPLQILTWMSNKKHPQQTRITNQTFCIYKIQKSGRYKIRKQSLGKTRVFRWERKREGGREKKKVRWKRERRGENRHVTSGGRRKKGRSDTSYRWDISWSGDDEFGRAHNKQTWLSPAVAGNLSKLRGGCGVELGRGWPGGLPKTGTLDDPRARRLGLVRRQHRRSRPWVRCVCRADGLRNTDAESWLHCDNGLGRAVDQLRRGDPDRPNNRRATGRRNSAPRAARIATLVSPVYRPSTLLAILRPDTSTISIFLVTWAHRDPAIGSIASTTWPCHGRRALPRWNVPSAREISR